jgi:hypothetical protein
MSAEASLSLPDMTDFPDLGPIRNLDPDPKTYRVPEGAAYLGGEDLREAANDAIAQCDAWEYEEPHILHAAKVLGTIETPWDRTGNSTWANAISQRFARITGDDTLPRYVHGNPDQFNAWSALCVEPPIDDAGFARGIGNVGRLIDMVMDPDTLDSLVSDESFMIGARATLFTLYRREQIMRWAITKPHNKGMYMSVARSEEEVTRVLPLLYYAIHALEFLVEYSDGEREEYQFPPTTTKAAEDDERMADALQRIGGPLDLPDLPPALQILVSKYYPMQRRLMAKFLRDVGHEVIVVENVEDAVEALDEHFFDMVVVDGNGCEEIVVVSLINGARHIMVHTALPRNYEELAALGNEVEIVDKSGTLDNLRGSLSRRIHQLQSAQPPEPTEIPIPEKIRIQDPSGEIHTIGAETLASGRAISHLIKTGMIPLAPMLVNGDEVVLVEVDGDKQKTTRHGDAFGREISRLIMAGEREVTLEIPALTAMEFSDSLSRGYYLLAEWWESALGKKLPTHLRDKFGLNVTTEIQIEEADYHGVTLPSFKVIVRLQGNDIPEA